MRQKGSIGDRLYLLALGFIFISVVFVAGLYSATQKNAAFKAVKFVQDSFEEFIGEIEVLSPAGRPKYHLQDARNDLDGLITNTTDDDHLVLLSGFFDNENEIRLIERDGTIVQRWPLPFYDFFSDVSYLPKPPATNRNVDLHGALIEPDGSIVFNFEYSGGAKLDRCGNVLWTLKHPVHHSLEAAEGGGYWIPGRAFIQDKKDLRFAPFVLEGDVNLVHEDLLLKVSDDGKILIEKSIPGLLFENGYESLLTATGMDFVKQGKEGGDNEIIHVNKIEELSSDIAQAFPMFEAGDLAISVRSYNLVFVVDPDTWKIKWLKTGPWRRQHDPEFGSDGRLYVFNNNVYLRGDDITKEYNMLGGKGLTNLIAINPATNETEVVYGNRAGETFLTVVRGKHELLPNGNILVTEFDAGRVFEINPNRERVWDYVNRYDEQSIAEITEARVYPRSYFTIEDWTCETK